MRLGLCCLFYEYPIKFKTARVIHIKKDSITKGQPLAYLSNLILFNVNSLFEAIHYCADHGIGCFRILSGLFPLCTYPDIAYQVEDLPNADNILKRLKECRELAREKDIRLVFHPDQFVILSSPQEKVVQNSIAELEYHGRLSELVGADVINIHAGGVYGDKASALERFKNNFTRLSSRVKARLTIENDDKCYSPQDLIPFCKELGIPFVYDVHHHRCLPDHWTIEHATQLALQTWNREPLFHLSSPKEGWQGPKPERHHDFIDLNDFPECWKRLRSVTIEIEAKAKELAVAKLKRELNAYVD